MVERMWPELEQPVAAAPRIGINTAGQAELVSPTPGASLGYRTDGGAWRLYTGPVDMVPGQVFEAKAVRYGFAESPVSRLAATIQ